MAYPYIPAKSISYGGSRALSSIKYIVVHYTANKGDTAINNAQYFANGNTRSAGAHFFVDQSGSVYQSIKIDLTAWSVGGFVTSANGAASLYNKCTNLNSVSIELCDLVNKNPSTKMINATRELVRHIQKSCPNAKTICRHWDVSGKPCPITMIGIDNANWYNFKKAITSAPVVKRDPIAYGYSKVGLNVYKGKPNFVDTNKDIPANTLVYCYGTFNDGKPHYDGTKEWVWWAINPEFTEWVVYTNRITRNKVFAKGVMIAGLTSYKTPNGSTTGRFYPMGTEVKCYGTFKDGITHSDGYSWVWWRITPLLDTPEWLVATKRIKVI